jgi:hypothetical protein
MAGGADFTLAALDDGSVIGWGTNAASQLGDGGTTVPPTTTTTLPPGKRHHPCHGDEDRQVGLRVLTVPKRWAAVRSVRSVRSGNAVRPVNPVDSRRG